MNTTITVPTVHGVDLKLTIDVDPYDGHVTVSTESPGQSSSTAHFDQDVEQGIAELLYLVNVNVRQRLAIAPWSES